MFKGKCNQGNYCGTKIHRKDTKCSKIDSIPNTKKFYSKSPLNNLPLKGLKGSPISLTYRTFDHCGAALVNNSFCLAKPANHGRCSRHRGMPMKAFKETDLPNSFTDPYDGEFGIDAPRLGTNEFVDIGAVIKYDYNTSTETGIQYEDEDFVSVQKKLTDIEIGGYSSSVHTFLISSATPIVKDDLESFELALLVYLESDFSDEEWYGHGTKIYGDIHFELDAPSEDKKLIFELAEASKEKRLEWISSEIGEDISLAKPQEFDLQNFEDLSSSEELNMSDINVSVPLGIVKKDSDGVKFLFGESNVIQAANISKQNGDIKEKVILYTI